MIKTKTLDYSKTRQFASVFEVGHLSLIYLFTFSFSLTGPSPLLLRAVVEERGAIMLLKYAMNTGEAVC